MGLFFNYDKPGPGIDKDAPKKKGMFLYIELFWRKLGKLFLSNMLYALVSLPVLLVYHFFVFYMLSAVLPAEITQDNTLFSQAVLLLTALLVIFWGTGPVSCGYTFLMRNFAREEHVWMVSDFFEHTRKNFKLSLLMFVIDLVVLATGTNAIYFYWKMSATIPALKYLAVLMVAAMGLYTIMHFYMYEFLVTFNVKLKDVYKNSLIMAFAAFPMNVFLVIFVTVLSYFCFSYLTPIAIILVIAIFWISFMRFPIDFYAARIIKRELIDKQKGDE